MTAAELLAECHAKKIILQAHDGHLDIDAPGDALTPALLARLQAHKPELLAMLAGGPQDVPGDAGPVMVASSLADVDPQPQDLPGGDRHGADGTQDAGPSDIDANDWQELTGSDGRRCLVRSDVADCEVVDLQPCPVCGCLLAWWDLMGGRHCEACSPRTAGPRLRELAQRLRERYERRAAG
jgi:hypothetical protein